MNPAESYILNQPEPFRSMLLHIKSVIEYVIPDAEIKYKWKIPCFYVDKSPICYLNVALKKNFVDVGFWNATHLTKHLDKMVSENRKVVKSLRYSTLEEIDNIVLTAILHDAYAVRKEKFYQKNGLN